MKINLHHMQFEFPRNTTPSPGGEPPFGKHGLPGTSDTRETPRQALRVGWALRAGPCTSGWDSGACPR